MGGQAEGARAGPPQAVGMKLLSLRPLRTRSSPGRTRKAWSPPALGPGPRARLRTVSLFTLKVIGSGLFIQISLQKCGNGDIFSICFPENKTKCKRPRREPRTFLGSPMSRSPLPTPRPSSRAVSRSGGRDGAIARGQPLPLLLSCPMAGGEAGEGGVCQSGHTLSMCPPHVCVQEGVRACAHVGVCLCSHAGCI